MFAVATLHEATRLDDRGGFGVGLSANPGQEKLIAFFNHFAPHEDSLERRQMLDARRCKFGRRNELAFHTQILACPPILSKKSIPRPAVGLRHIPSRERLRHALIPFRLGRRRRQFEDERTPLTYGALHTHLAAMFLKNLAGYWQP